MQPIDEGWSRALAVVAHPDDLEYGAASAVARWTAQGKEVSYVLATSGEAGIAGLSPDRCGPLREEEERRSAAVVGVAHVEFLGFPDGGVEYGLPLRHAIAGALRRLRPEVVIGMNFDLSWGDEGTVNHADHRAVGLATLDAVRDAANEWVDPDGGTPWSGVTRVYVGGSSSPTHYVDVGDTLHRGIESLRQHNAYIAGLGVAFDPAQFLTDMAGFAGMAAGVDRAVLFQAYKA